MAGETTTESNGNNGKKADFLDECEQYLGSRNLYELLGLERTADEAAIKSAYRKKSLKVHPDRAPEDRKEHAKRAFQTLTKVHVILTTENLRAVYDETGMVLTGDEQSFEGFASYEEVEKYWRTIFPKISTKQIDEYLERYIGSEEEVADLKALYGRFEGDLSRIYEYHYAYDEERVVAIYRALLEKEEIPAFPAFVDEPARKKARRLKRIQAEAKEAEEEKAKMAAKKNKRKKKNKKRENEEENGEDEEEGENEAEEEGEGDEDEANGAAGSLAALQAAIQNKNRANFGSMLSNLEAKYGKKKPSGGKKATQNGKNGNKKRRNK